MSSTPFLSFMVVAGKLFGAHCSWRFLLVVFVSEIWSSVGLMFGRFGLEDDEGPLFFPSSLSSLSSSLVLLGSLLSVGRLWN